MKKAVSLILAVIIFVSVTACGKEESAGKMRRFAMTAEQFRLDSLIHGKTSDLIKR